MEGFCKTLLSVVFRTCQTTMMGVLWNQRTKRFSSVKYVSEKKFSEILNKAISLGGWSTKIRLARAITGDSHCYKPLPVLVDPRVHFCVYVSFGAWLVLLPPFPISKSSSRIGLTLKLYDIFCKKPACKTLQIKNSMYFSKYLVKICK